MKRKGPKPQTSGRSAKRRHTGKIQESVVRYYVQGPSDKLIARALSSSQLIERLRAGLSFEELDELQGGLGLSMDRLGPMLGISKATLHRRKASGRLDAAESDRVVRFARLLGLAVEVLESPASARQWLSSPQVGLGGAVPLKYAETEVGAREVEDLLGRIEYGVYS